MTDGPLAGLRVLEMCGWNGVLAGRLLADAGADVVRVTSKDDPLRKAAPFLGAGGTSLQDAWYNAGKRFVFDPGDAAVGSFVRAADILIEDEGAPFQGFDEILNSAHARGLVHVTVSPFGSTGPWSSFKTTDIVANALSGASSVTGDAATGPLNGWGNQTYHTVGLYAAICAMAGIRARRTSGRGMHIDLSAHEALASCTEQVLMQWFFPEGGPWKTQIAERLGGMHWSRIYDVYRDRVGDGLMVTAALRPVDVLVPWLGESGDAGDLGDPARYPDVMALMRDGAHVMDVLRTWVGANAADDLFFEAQRRRLPFGAVWDIPTAAGTPQVEAKRYFQQAQMPGGVRAAMPGRLFRTSADEGHPEPGVVASVTGVAWTPREAARTNTTSPHDPSRPLEGIRVLDFTHVLAGPFGTRVLGDLGADIIKVGSAARGGGANSPAHPYYVSWNRNKRSIAIDMSAASSRDLARRLAAECDIVIDNFSAGVLARWGLDHASIKETNPRVTSIAMGGMGTDGPWANFVTFAPTIHALVGLTYLTGVPGRNDIGYGFSLTDHLSGLAAAFAALEGVEHAATTGRGLDIDLAQYELGLGLMAPAFMDYFANGVAAEPCGNASPYGDHAPHGIYRCAGEDTWLAIACADDHEWHAARIVLGLPARAEWSTREGRHHDREALDETIASATQLRDRFELMEALQEVGVPAGPVMTAEDLATANPQLAERGFFGTAECERFGTYGLDRFPALFDGVRPARYDGPVAVGTDTYDVLSTILGIDDDTIAGLMAEGALT